MKMNNVILYLFIVIIMTPFVSAEGEIISGDTIYVENDEFFMSATPHTLYESGNVTFVVRSKSYIGDIDMIWGFDKATAKIKSVKYKDEKVKEIKKPKNKIVNKKHLLYTDEKRSINIDNEIKFVTWIDVSELGNGKYDFMIKPSYLTIDEARDLNRLYILDPWYDNEFHYKSMVCIDSRLNFYSQTDTQVLLNFSYNSNMQSDFDDIRFYDVGTSAQIPYWIQEYNESNWCKVWVKLPNLWGQIWNNVSTEMYYGNVGVSNVSNMSDTFIQSHGYSTSSFSYPNVIVACSMEGKIYHPTIGVPSYIGISNNEGSEDAVFAKIVNGVVMNALTMNDSVNTEISYHGSQIPLAVYKCRFNGNFAKFFVNDSYTTSTNTNQPDELMGLTYTSVSGGYCEWAFVRKFVPFVPTTLIKDETNIFFKHNPTAYTINSVYQDGETISISGDPTQWRAVGHVHTAYAVVNEYNNGTGEFEIISDYSLAEFTVSGFIPDSYITLNKENEFSVTLVVDSSGECQFDEILLPGVYTVSSKSYDNITGVHGFIYEGTDGSTIPLSETVIYIYNNTWSDTTTSDSGGYYVFTNLSNSTYTLNFKKDRYAEVLYQYVTPYNRSMYYKNIYMQKSSGEFYARHYCTFVLKNIFGVRYPDVDVVLYKNGGVEESSTTGYDGSVVFNVYEDSEYRLTFINVTQNINEEITVMPRDDRYIIWIGSYSLAPENDTRSGNVDYWWTENEIDVAHTWLNFSYKNPDNKTTFINYWINDTNGVIVYHDSESYPCSAGIYESNYIVDSSNNTFVVHFSAHHIDYPGLENSVVQTFSYYHGRLIDLFFDAQWQYTVVSLFLIIILGTLFGATNAAQGSLIMVLCAWFFSFIGWLPTSIIGYGAIVLATLLSIGWNLRKNDIVHT